MEKQKLVIIKLNFDGKTHHVKVLHKEHLKILEGRWSMHFCSEIYEFYKRFYVLDKEYASNFFVKAKKIIEEATKTSVNSQLISSLGKTYKYNKFQRK